MSFRVTPSHFANLAIRHSQMRSDTLLKLQDEISSGKSTTRPSDDPAGYASLVHNKAFAARLRVDVENVTAARSNLNQSVNHLRSISDGFIQARSLALDGVQSLDRAVLAQSVNGILDAVLHAANSSNGGTTLFGGTSNVDSPFQITDTTPDGDVSHVEYIGSSERSSIVVGMRLTVDAIYGGDEVFQASDRMETIFIGNTGVAAGIATDNAVGRGGLIVRHTATTIAAGSGLALGSSSANDDTIIGSHTLHVDDTNKTITLDGGNVQSFDGTETDLKVFGLNGDVVHLDMTGLVGGFSGDVTVFGDGTVSVDEGATEVPIDFTTNQVVTHSIDGTVTNIDSSNIQRIGSEHIEYHGTSDVFQVLIDLRDELLNTRDLPEDVWQEAIARRIADVTRAHEHILTVIGDQSVNLENLESIEQRAQDNHLETLMVVEDLEAADLASSVLRLQEEQNLLQFTYATSVRLMGMSVLPFLQ